MGISLIKGGLLGGLALYLWGALSWSVLPWHDMTMSRFANEDAVAAVILENAKGPGVYLLPNAYRTAGTPERERKAAYEAAERRMAQGPMVFASVRIAGAASLKPYVFVAVIISVLAAALGTLLLLLAGITGYLKKALFLALFGLAAGVACDLPSWNWLNFPAAYTLVSIADLTAGWFLAGLVIARVAGRNDDEDANKAVP